MKQSKIGILRIAFLGLVCIYCFFAPWAPTGAQAQQTIRPARVDYRIQLRAYRFDPLTARPRIPDDLRIAETPKEPAYYVVQFVKSLTKEERAEVQGKYGLKLKDYVPNFSYLEKIGPETLAQIKESKLFRWADLYHPAYKISPSIGKRLDAAEYAGRPYELQVLLFLDADTASVKEKIQALGLEVLNVWDEPQHGQKRIKVKALDLRRLKNLVSIPGVRWVEEFGRHKLRSDTVSWILQTNVLNSRTINAQGLRGENQIVGHIDGVMDINHCFFEDAADNNPRPAHRKVVAYRSAGGIPAAFDDHGTLTASIVAGQDLLTAGAVPDNRRGNDGNAYRARLTHADLDDIAGFGADASNLYASLAQQYGDGAFVFTNSWGDDGTTDYTSFCEDIDRFMWNHEDALVVFAATNLADLKSPENAKNVLAVAATNDTPNQQDIGSGGDGPTDDGRRKPEITAPGCPNIQGADANTACGVRGDCGTSFAAPAIAAYGAIVRQYFTEGWYPTGTRQPHHAFTPSGSLLKATLLNATVDMTGTDEDGDSLAGYPNDREGWGRLLLERGLFFNGDALNLRVWDYRNDDGLYTGQTRTHQVDVAAGGQPLKVTLVWTEPPSSAGSASPVTNDLDLTVTSPGGAQTFLGNQFAGGVSAAGGAADALNNVEMVLVNNPAAGEWTITVAGTAVNVGNPAQGYALVVTADTPEPPQPGGNQDTLVVRVKFNDIAYEPPLPNLQNLMTDVVSYFNEVAYGQATVLPEYRGPLALDHPKDYYYHPSRNLLIELTQEAVEKLVAADPNVFDKGTPAEADDIDRMIIVTNDVNFTGDWATTGPWPYDMPGGFTRPISVSVQSYANIDARYTHGLGHQFGLVDLYAHPGVVFPRSYVDEWCNMGGLFNNAHFLVWNKDRARWVTTHGSTVEYFPRPAAGGNVTQTYELFNQESTGANRKAVAVGLTEGAANLAAEDVFYYIEARDNTLGGFDDNLPASGVLIYYVNELIPQGEGPVILRDKNPGTPTLTDAAFAVGDSFTIPGTGITIDVLAPTGGANCNVRVTYAPPATDYNVFITKGDTIDGTFYGYFSPDIWIDSPKNGWNLGGGPPPSNQIENPVVNMVNRLYARIHNSGPGIAYDFDVRFRVSEPYQTVGGEADFNRFVGIKHVASLDRTEGAGAPTAPLIIYVEWTPDDDGDPHSCVWVDLINLVGNDTNQYDNGAQENLNEVASLTASPYHPVTYSYTLKNPFAEQALFYFRAEDVPQGWTAVLNPEKILLDPDERVEGAATITPPPEAEVCTSHRIQITSWTPRGDTIVPVGGGVVQVDLRKAGNLTYKTSVESCRKVDPKLRAMAVAPGGPCYSIRTQGCTDPPQANQEIIIKYTDPLGQPVYRTVMTDANGCFEDFFVSAQGGTWQVDVEFPGNDCAGPIEPPTQVVVVPPTTFGPARGLGYSFHLGMNFPVGSFTRDYDPGPSLTLDLDYVLRDNLSLVGLVGFHYFHGVESDLSWTNLSLNAKLFFPFFGWRWYLAAGPGIYMPNAGTKKFGMNLGTGINFPIQPRLALELGADYHLVDPGGLKQTFIDLKMGMIFRF